MKESAKLYKQRSPVKKYSLGKRLYVSADNEEQMKIDDSNVSKRKKGADGKMIVVEKQQPTPMKGQKM